MAVLYAAIAAMWAFGARANVPPVVAAFWALTCALCAALAFFAGRPKVSARYANPAVTLVVLMALQNALWLLALTGDFVYTSVLYLILLGAAVMLLSIPAFLVVAVAAVSGWTFIAAAWHEPDVWVRWGFNLYSAAMVGFLAQFMRVRTYAKLERLRQKDAERIRQESELARLAALNQDRIRLLNLTSHEIATPLTPVMLRMQTVRAESARLSRDAAEALEVIDRNLGRLRASMDDVMEAIHLQSETNSLRLQDTLVASLVEDAIRRVRASTGSHIDYLVDVEPTLRVPIDAGRLGKALRRVMDAAARRLPGHGVISVTARRGPSRLEVKVADNGPNLDEASHRELFELFSPGYDYMHRTASDIGLGLFIARCHIEAHGGRVWYEPRAGGGSVFGLSVPIGGPVGQDG